MTAKKPIIDNGIILYKDYEYLFNMLTDEELGAVIRNLYKNTLNPTLNPTDNQKINNVFNYIASRIIDYNEKKKIFSNFGKRGGNPNISKACTLNPTLNPTLKLSKEKKREVKISKDKDDSNTPIAPFIEIDETKENDNSFLKTIESDKQSYGVSSKVKLTSSEIDHLLSVYGTKERLDRAINILAGYSNDNPARFKKYKNHALVLRKDNWVYMKLLEIERCEARGFKPSQNKPNFNDTFNQNMEIMKKVYEKDEIIEAEIVDVK